MYSASCEWREGREAWAVVHSSEEAIDHLAVRGDPPEGWRVVQDEHLEKQARELSGEVDYLYEVPLVIAQRVVGYRLDADEVSPDFVTLGSISRGPTSRPWWKIWTRP